jgi:hypothetical protein
VSQSAHEFEPTGAPPDRGEADDALLYKVVDGPEGPFFNGVPQQEDKTNMTEAPEAKPEFIFDPNRLLDEVIQTHVEMRGPREDGKYDDIEIGLSDQAMIGTELIPTHPIARVRATLRFLEQAAPDSLNKTEGIPVEIVLSKFHQRLTAEVTLVPKKGDQAAVRVQRGVILEANLVTFKLEQIWQTNNHPLAQVLNFVSYKYNVKHEDEVEGENVGPLSQTDFALFRTALILGSQETLIETIYDDYIARFRSIVNQKPA